MEKERDEAYELLKELVSNNYQWQSNIAMPKKMVGVHELDVILAIHAQLALLMKKLDATNVSAIQTRNSLYGSYAAGQCCNEGQVGNFVFSSNEQANYMSNYQRNNNPYSSTYTPAWRNRLNLGWGGNNNIAPKPTNFQL